MILVGTEKHSYGRTFICLANIAIEGFQVEIQLPEVLRFELACFELHFNQAGKATVKEQQVEREVLAADLELHLAPDKSPAPVRPVTHVGFVEGSCADPIHVVWSGEKADSVGPTRTPDDVLADTERIYLREVLRATRGSIDKAKDIAGMSYSTFLQHLPTAPSAASSASTGSSARSSPGAERIPPLYL